MTSAVGSERTTTGKRLSRFGQQHPNIKLGGLLTGPVLWLVLAYIGSLAALLIAAFWRVDGFTTKLVRNWNLGNFREMARTTVYRTITFRTIGVAFAVTVICMMIAVPMAFTMAKIMKPNRRRLAVVAVLMPLWSSYLVKSYAWRIIFIQGGVLEWAGLPSPGFGLTATVILLSYLWLPYMILPIYAGFERLPNSLLEASADLGGKTGRTFRSVILPMIKPSLIAGSIFTFSLTMGDYIAVGIVGGKSQFLGNTIYAKFGTANNLPLAAALSTIPVVAMVIYLMSVRRTGALENL